jgi:RNA polymerase sigma-70 factor (ECF subfamily)
MNPGSDPADIEQLYRRFGPAVHRRALSLTRDAQEALDVTQETFLAFLKARSSLRSDASPFTVLYQIATYQSVDRLRRRSRWFGSVGRLDFAESQPDDDQTIHEATAHEGGARQVEAAQDLALLTKGEKPEVLTAAFLYFVEGHTTGEVAQVLDLSRKTVGKLLAQFAERARKRQARLEQGAAP